MDTCKAAGMHAVCPGSSTCGYNSDKCLVTPLSSPGCPYLTSLSQHLCNYGPTQCPEIDGIFVHMHNWGTLGAFGVVGNKNGAYGKDYVSGNDGQTYFAFCFLST